MHRDDLRPRGLDIATAQNRLQGFGPNRLQVGRSGGTWACGGVLSLGLAAVTWEPLASLLGFAPMGPEVWAVVVVVVGAYALTTEAVKRWRG